MIKKALFSVLILSALAAGQAQATPFGFAADPSDEISQGYQGFDYTGGFGTSSWVNDLYAPQSANQGIGATPLGAAWSNGGTELILTSATPGGLFDFGSVDLDPGRTSTVTLEGLVNGQVVDSWTGTLVNQSAYTDVVLNWTNVEEVTFSDPNVNLFVTDLNTQHVPEPASLALFGAGLLGLAMLRKKDKRA